MLRSYLKIVNLKLKYSLAINSFSFLRLLIAFITTHFSYSQNQTANWLFSDSSFITFKSTGIVASNSLSIYAYEACSSVSDTAGNLLFYTNGLSVYDKNGQSMPNGYFGTSQYVSTTTQGVLIVPNSYNKNQYYLFTNNYKPNNDFLFYTIIDMNLNFGLGDVLFQPRLFYKSDISISEKLTVAKHCNGKDYWIITTETIDFGDSIDLNPIKYSGQKIKDVNFLSFYLSEYGVSNIPIKSKTNVLTNDCEQNRVVATGQLKISPNNKLAAFGHLQDLYVFTFNSSSGVFSPFRSYKYPSISVPAFCEYVNYGVEFFSNSRSLMFNNLYVDLYNNTSQVVGNFIYSQMQLSKDRKIYFANNIKQTGQTGVTTKNKLSFFDLNTSTCLPFYDTISLKNGSTSFGLPNFASFYFQDAKFDFTYNGACLNSIYTFSLINSHNYPINNIQWFFTDDNTTSSLTNPSHLYSFPGDYQVQLIVNSGGNQDTVVHCIHVQNTSINLFENSDTVVCKNKSIDIGVTYPIYGKYLWNTGDTTSAIKISTEGKYYFTVVNSCYTLTDTITVHEKLCTNKITKFTIPNIFTPNADGINDQWGLIFENSTIITNFNVIIYNRWGVKIMEGNQPKIKWDGYTTSGIPCPDGVYFFICTFVENNEYKSFKGNITLLR